VEMEFRFETVASLRGGDRRALHERRLQQSFRSSPYRHAFSLGRNPGRRGEEKLLLSAVTNPDLVSPWTASLRQAHLPLSGIASVPVLQQRLVRCLASDNPHVLLLTVQRRGGIRISYFFQGELRFSRLAAHSGDLAALGPVAQEEAVRTHQYLLGLRLLERNCPVDAVCLLPEDIMAAWNATSPVAGLLRLSHTGLAQAARLAGIRDESAGRSTDDLLIGLLAKARFPNHFAPPRERHGFHLHRLRRGLLAGSAAAALGAVAGSGVLLHGAWDRLQGAQEAQAAASAVNASIQQVRAGFPQTSVPVEEIREALDLTQNLQQESAPARRLLADLSRGFDAVAQAELNTLTWASTDHPERFSDEGSQGGGAAPANPPAAADGGSGRRWVAILQGDIVGAGSYRQANAATEALAEAIRRNRLAVDILQYPLNVQPDAELKDNFEQDAAERLPFRLRVTWKP
ncbi:MAG TPA: hypothetical protein VJ576_19345, partial [Rhodocyclaceae bacterium]|nr:hypothetical protein [Rhodocyclaceae bacterium]